MLKCCFCIFPKPGAGVVEIKDALTVIGGFAVCQDHLSVVTRGGVWHELITIARH